MLDTPEKKKAARRTPDGSQKSTAGKKVDKEHESLAQQLFSRVAITSKRVSAKPERVLPLREEAKLRDEEARARLLRGQPVVDQDEYRRPDFATAMTADQFRSSPRRGRR